MNKYLTEFVGTFLFILSIALVVVSGSAMAPLVIGCALMIVVYMGGHISGGHYNPAVTVAVMLRGKCSPADVVPYWIAQVGGGIAAAAVAKYLTGKGVPIAIGEGYDVVQGLLVEVIYTFALCLVVLNVATSPKTAGNSYYGLAIGFTIVVAAFSAGSISGGAFNPAVGISLALIGGTIQGAWLYVVGPIAGAILAAIVYNIQHAGVKE